jgi:hypothetical protein
MSQHLFPLPPTTPTAEPPRGDLRARRRKLLAAALGAVALASAGSLALALRANSAPEAAPASDVPRREGNAIVVSAHFREVTGLQTVAALSVPLVPLLHAVGSRA